MTSIFCIGIVSTSIHISPLIWILLEIRNTCKSKIYMYKFSERILKLTNNDNLCICISIRAFDIIILCVIHNFKPNLILAPRKWVYTHFKDYHFHIYNIHTFVLYHGLILQIYSPVHISCFKYSLQIMDI